MTKFYTGVGSRSTPLYILYMMSEIAVILEKKGFVLRSGCATGADAAFEDALSHPFKTSEIYIPNKEFPSRMGTSYKNHYIIPKEKFGIHINGLYNQATRLIHQYEIHKYWFRCSTRTMDLHNRNIFQVLGQDLKTRSSFNICYTKNKELKYTDTNRSTGGTGTSINASDLYKIKLFNLSVDEHYIRLLDFIEKNKSLLDYDTLNKIKPRSEFNIDNNVYYQKSYNDLMHIIIDEKNNRLKNIKI